MRQTMRQQYVKFIFFHSPFSRNAAQIYFDVSEAWKLCSYFCVVPTTPYWFNTISTNAINDDGYKIPIEVK